MQNEELRRSQRELEVSQARYSDLYDFPPVGYCTVSEKELILEANLTAAAMLGVARSALVKKPLTRFIHKEGQEIYYRYSKKLFETGEPQACELQMMKQDGMGAGEFFMKPHVMERLGIAVRKELDRKWLTAHGAILHSPRPKSLRVVATDDRQFF
jgi:PAS domain S-box-containing protein